MTNIFKKTALALAATLTLSLPTATQAASDASPKTVDKDFATYTLDWTPNGESFIRWGVFDHDGYIAVCGAYTVSKGAKTLTATKKALLATEIKLNGTRILTSLSFFNDVPNEYLANELEGQTANCKVTDTPSSAAKDGGFEIELNQTKFRF